MSLNGRVALELAFEKPGWGGTKAHAVAVDGGSPMSPQASFQPPMRRPLASPCVVPIEVRTPTMSLGADGHQSGTCKPCAWYWRPQGCSNGAECRHCHLCAAGEAKARRKNKLVTLRSQLSETSKSATDASHGAGGASRRAASEEDGHHGESRMLRSQSHHVKVKNTFIEFYSDEEEEGEMPMIAVKSCPAHVLKQTPSDWRTKSCTFDDVDPDTPAVIRVESMKQVSPTQGLPGRSATVDSDSPTFLDSPTFGIAQDAAGFSSNDSRLPQNDARAKPDSEAEDGSEGFFDTSEDEQDDDEDDDDDGPAMTATRSCPAMARKASLREWAQGKTSKAARDEDHLDAMYVRPSHSLTEKVPRALPDFRRPVVSNIQRSMVQEALGLHFAPRHFATGGLPIGPPPGICGPPGISHGPPPGIPEPCAPPRRQSLPAALSTTVTPFDMRKPEWSIGSAAHTLGQCRPCAWFWRQQGCINGAECRHCHLCPFGEVKARRKQRVASLRQQPDE